jgi:hypothetical protein
MFQNPSFSAPLLGIEDFSAVRSLTKVAMSLFTKCLELGNSVNRHPNTQNG